MICKCGATNYRDHRNAAATGYPGHTYTGLVSTDPAPRHHAEKVWACTNNNHTNYHAFGLRSDGNSAFCNKRIQANWGVDVPSGDGLVSRTDRENARLHPATFCEKCSNEVQRMVDRREASMEPRGMDYLND